MHFIDEFSCLILKHISLNSNCFSQNPLELEQQSSPVSLTGSSRWIILFHKQRRENLSSLLPVRYEEIRQNRWHGSDWGTALKPLMMTSNENLSPVTIREKTAAQESASLKSFFFVSLIKVYMCLCTWITKVLSWKPGVRPSMLM